MSASNDRAMDIVADVLEAPEVRRVAVLEAACGGDGALRAEVERLLDVGLGPRAKDLLEALEAAGAAARDHLTPAAGDGRGAAAGAGGRSLPDFGRYRTVRLRSEERRVGKERRYRERR